MHAFFFGSILHGAVQGWLVLQLLDGMLEPKSTERQSRIGQAMVILAVAAAYLGNFFWNHGNFSNFVLLFRILLTTAESLLFYHSNILYVVCLNGLLWAGITLCDFFAQVSLDLFLGTFKRHADTVSMLFPENNWLLFTGSAVMIPIGIVLNRFCSEHRHTLSEYRRTLPVMALLTIASVFCFQSMPRQLLLHWTAFLLCSFLLFAAIWLGMLKYDAEAKNNMLRLKMSSLEEKYQALLENNKEHAILVHDIRNHLRTVSTMLEQKKSQEAAAYLLRLNGNAERIHPVTWSHHEMLDLILNMKFREAQKARIAVECQCDDMCGLTLRPDQICALFSNLLDNAIEANEKCPPGIERRLSLQVFRREKMLVVSLSNPIADSSSQSPAKQGSRFPETTKHDKALHGFGLRSIQNVANSYHGYMKTERQGDTFYTVVYLAAFEEQIQSAT